MAVHQKAGKGVSGPMQALGRWLVVAVCVLGVAGAPVSAQQPAALSSLPVKTGQRISLDLKGVDILDVLKLLSQKSGLNFVAGRNLSGRVTIFVNDVDVWEAFELIIGANELAYERQGTIVTVMMARDYELLYGQKFQERKRNLVRPLKYAKAIQVATVLNQVKSSVGQVVTDEATNTLILSDVSPRLDQMQALLDQLDRPTDSRVYTLNYAEAEKLKDKVKEWLSPVGTFTFDARTNKAVVSDLNEILAKIDRLIGAFDTPDGEVLIEAKIVKVELTNEMDLGIDWQQVFGGIDAQSRSNFRVLGDIIGGTTTGAAMKLLTARGNTQVIIEALKKITKTETLANPRIMVSNNQEAKILVGTKEAVVTVTTTVPATGATVSAPEIQYVDVGTKLYVTPNIKSDGHIQMKIRPEVSSATVETFQTNRIPIVTSTEAETNVLVKSGSTLIIGGLIETKNTRTESRLPVLGDLPVVGMAFRGSTDTKKKTELVVFLTPTIVMPDGSAFTFPTSAELQPQALLGAVSQPQLPAAYRQAVRQRLQAYLLSRFRAAQLAKGGVALSFVLNRDGTLGVDHEVTSPDGQPFIQAAETALAEAQPFPAFPDGTTAKSARFSLAVDYTP